MHPKYENHRDLELSGPFQPYNYNSTVFTRVEEDRGQGNGREGTSTARGDNIG